MAEIINFAKAKKNLDKELKLILNDSTESDKIIKKRSKKNQIEDDKSAPYTLHKVDENTTVKVFGNGIYWIQHFVPGDTPTCC